MIIRVDQANLHLEVDTKGGRIVHLVFHNQEILGTFDRIDGKKGSTHLCSPNFGAEGKDLGLPFHGPARNDEWTVIEQSSSLVVLHYFMPQTGTYPGGLEYKQTLQLFSDLFIHEIQVTNKTQKDLPVNIGVHNYWSTPQGWKGTKVNGTDITSYIETNGSIPLVSENKIIFPGKPTIQFSVSGFADAVLWAGYVGNVYDEQYACIEPVLSAHPHFFGGGKSIVSRNKTLNVKQTISLLEEDSV